VAAACVMNGSNAAALLRIHDMHQCMRR